MKKKKWQLAALLVISLALTACGSSRSMMTESAADEGYYAAPASGGSYLSEGSEDYYFEGAYANDTAVMEEAEVAEAYDDAAMDTGSGGSGTVSENTNKKLIRTVNMQVETQEFDALVRDLRTEVETLGGYVEKYTTSDYNDGISRDAYIEARVPADCLDGFLERIGGQSNVVFQDETVEDVTLQYVDLDTHKKSLITERDRLLELLEKAENVEDLIVIESRLSEVRYQIESLEAQLRTIDNQVTYSTVYLSIREVKLYTPAAEESIWQRISSGFVGNVYSLVWWLEDFVVGCAVNLPFILIWIVILVLFLIILRLICRMLRRKIGKKIDGMKEKRKVRLEQIRREQENGEDYEVIPARDGRETKEDSAEQDDTETEKAGDSQDSAGTGER